MRLQGAGTEAQVLRTVVGHRDGIDLPVLGVQRRLAPHKLGIPQARRQNVPIQAAGLAIGVDLQPRRAPGGEARWGSGCFSLALSHRKPQSSGLARPLALTYPWSSIVTHALSNNT